MAKKEEKKETKKKVSAEPEEVKEEAAPESSAAEESTAAPESSDVEAKLCEQLKKKDEQYLRLAAEYDNYRKRTAKEKEDTFVNAKVSVLENFLEVADNFERAKDATGTLEDYQKGIELIFTQFLEKLKALGAEPFGEAGESFDPELHMAVMHVEDEEKGEGEIVEVFQKGYKLGDKVIRHAAVKVAN